MQPNQKRCLCSHDEAQRNETYIQTQHAYTFIYILVRCCTTTATSIKAASVTSTSTTTYYQRRWLAVYLARQRCFSAVKYARGVIASSWLLNFIGTRVHRTHTCIHSTLRKRASERSTHSRIQGLEKMAKQRILYYTNSCMRVFVFLSFLLSHLVMRDSLTLIAIMYRSNLFWSVGRSNGRMKLLGYTVYLYREQIKTRVYIYALLYKYIRMRVCLFAACL